MSHLYRYHVISTNKSSSTDGLLKTTVLDRIIAVATGLVLELIARPIDLALLLIIMVLRPTLLFAYLKLWVTEIVRSPYRWPKSFESALRLKASGQQRRELLYGEVIMATAIFLFWRAGMGGGSQLVDLGAGRGRSLLAARWLGAEARGIELLESHVRLTAPALKAAGAVLEQGDAMQASCKEATHIFLNWCGFSDATKSRISEQLRNCRPGTRIIAVTRPVKGKEFVIRAQTLGLFTWGVERVWIQEFRPHC